MLCRYCGYKHSDWVGCDAAASLGLREQTPALLKPADAMSVYSEIPQKPKFDRVAHMAWVREQKKKKALLK